MQDRAANALWQVTCQCGWRTYGTRATLVPAVQAHGRSAHGLEISEEEVMALAVPSTLTPK